MGALKYGYLLALYNAFQGQSSPPHMNPLCDSLGIPLIGTTQINNTNAHQQAIRD